MPKAKEPTVTLFCSNCGDTKTFRENDDRALAHREGMACNVCLHGEILRAVSTMEPGE